MYVKHLCPFKITRFEASSYDPISAGTLEHNVEEKEEPEPEEPLEIVSDGCFGDSIGYCGNDPIPKCYPVENSRPNKTTPEGVGFCLVLGYAFSPPDLLYNDIQK